MCHHPHTLTTLERARFVIREVRERIKELENLGIQLDVESAKAFKRYEFNKRLVIYKWHIDTIDTVAIRYAFRSVIDGDHNEDMKRECASLLTSLDNCIREKQ